MARRTRILFVGDSVTAGYGLAGAPSFARLTAERLTDRGLAVDVVVDALDGADSRYLLKRFDRMVTAHDPDWVVLAVGLNDARPPEGREPNDPASFAGNLLEIVDRVLSLGAKLMLVAQNPRWSRKPAADDLMSPYATVVRSISEALALPVVDLHHAFLVDADGPALIPDGTHPNALGHELIADLVTEELLPLVGPPRPRAAADAARAPYDPFSSNDSHRN